VNVTKPSYLPFKPLFVNYCLSRSYSLYGSFSSYLRPYSSIVPGCRGRHQNPPHCGGVVWPTCGNPSARWFQLYNSMPLFYIILFACTVNNANSSRFDHKPQRARPVQGSRPEVPPRDLAPYSHKVASGLFSHQKPPNHALRRHLLFTAISHFPTLFLTHFRTLRLGTHSHILFKPSTRPLPGSPTQIKNLHTGRSPLPQRMAGRVLVSLRTCFW
jgi:hypothetical protein